MDKPFGILVRLPAHAWRFRRLASPVPAQKWQGAVNGTHASRASPPLRVFERAQSARST